mmetsp:Transcript_435/g.1134  ORF Transcript_435/g.1134 Transcript_435/m.1134 type:complete len:323 (-) Transcript_435:116-1084(-)
MKTKAYMTLTYDFIHNSDAHASSILHHLITSSVCRVGHNERASPIAVDRLLRLYHSILHQPISKSSVHTLKRHNLAHDRVPGLGPLEDHDPRVPHPDPDAVPPRVDRRRRPIGDCHVSQLASPAAKCAIRLLADEVRVCPLVVQELQAALVLLRERRGRVVALAPCRDHQRASGLQHARHFLDVGLLVRHMLARLARPDKVERVIRIVHLQRVHHLEVHVVQVSLLCELRGPLYLVRGQRNAGHLRTRVGLGEVPASSTDAATDIKHALGRIRGAPLEHLVNKCVLCLDEITFLVPGRALLLRIVAQVNVLAPVVFEDALRR